MKSQNISRTAKKLEFPKYIWKSRKIYGIGIFFGNLQKTILRTVSYFIKKQQQIPQFLRHIQLIRKI